LQVVGRPSVYSTHPEEYGGKAARAWSWPLTSIECWG